MNRSPPKPAKSAEELRAELEWAVQVLTGDASADRVVFALPTPASVDASLDYNWDVEVSCRPDQDEAVQAAIVHVAEKWNLAAADGVYRGASASIRVARSDAAAPMPSPPAADTLSNGSRRYDAQGPCGSIEFE